MTKQNFEAMRDAMVASQLRTNAVSDPDVIAAMQSVAREDFVPAERRSLAYVDIAIPLGGDRALSAPLVIGRLLTEAMVNSTDHVLLVGASTGYAATLLSQLAKSVVALESDTALLEAGRAALSKLPNTVLVAGPLTDGWEDAAPYDVIVIDGAVAHLPDALLGQLKPGGRLVSGLFETGVTRLAFGTRAGQGVGMVSFADAEVPVLSAFAMPKTFVF